MRSCRPTPAWTPDSAREFLARIDAAASDGGDLPWPARWGGDRVWAERVELWVGQPARAHDRAAWTRTLTPAGDGFARSGWRATRLMP